MFFMVFEFLYILNHFKSTRGYMIVKLTKTWFFLGFCYCTVLNGNIYMNRDTLIRNVHFEELEMFGMAYFSCGH